MPHTVNGIGTHYYGKKNRQNRLAVCQSCQREGNLASYDTRLWFVFIFIPLIPLGRKRIVDYCPSCSRHYAVELAKWEAQKQLDVSGAAEKFRDQPTPEAAMEMHEQLLGYQQLPQAAEFRPIMLQKFPGNAKVLEYLGVACSRIGLVAEGRQHLLRAHELRPDLPDARVGVALMRMQEGKLDEARGLLDFMEKPGAAQLYNVGPLETLADAYQAQGRHREALALYGGLLAELPAVADHAGFRKKVLVSEKALGERQSLLPKKKFRLWGNRGQSTGGRRKLAIAGVIMLLLAVGFGVTNEWIRRHRRVHVVNGLMTPVTVSIAGVGAVAVAPGKVEELTVTEGIYQAVVKGALTEEIPITVRADYWDRFFSSPLWIVNPGGAGILEHKVAVYSASGDPSAVSYASGERFSRYGDIDYQFRPAPSTMSMKSRERRRVKTSVELFTGSGADVFYAKLEDKKSAEATRFAEQRLALRPDDSALLSAYVSSINDLTALPRLEKILEAGLSFRPLQIEWHRIYQNLIKNVAREQRMIAAYDAMLAKEPGHSGLLYLRGRVSTDRKEARQYFDRAREKDPGNPYPLLALGYDEFLRGDFAAARPLLEEAAGLRSRDEHFTKLWRDIRIATGERPAVEAELRKRFARDPSDLQSLMELAMMLAADRRLADAEKLIGTYLEKNRKLLPRPKETLGFMRLPVLYAAGDFTALEKAIKETRAPGGLPERMAFQLAVERGGIEEAVKTKAAQNYLQGGAFAHLTVSLAWDLAGRAPEAAAARDTAAEALATEGADERRAAALLRRPIAPTKEELGEVVLRLEDKAVLCAVLARKFPARRTEFAKLATQFNFNPSFPHHLVQRAATEFRE